MKLGKTFVFVFSFLVCILAAYNLLHAGLTVDFSGDNISWGIATCTKDGSSNYLQYGSVECNNTTLVAAQGIETYGYPIVPGSGWSGSSWASVMRQQNFTISDDGIYNLNGALNGYFYVMVSESGSGTAQVDAYTKVVGLPSVNNNDSLSVMGEYGWVKWDIKTVNTPFNQSMYLAAGDYIFEEYLKVGISAYSAPIAVSNFGGVVPEPISSILFITGGTLLAGRRFLRRKA